MNKLSDKLTYLREKAGWSKTEVSRRLGLKGMSTYANWEYGTREPDVGSLKSIAQLFGVSLDYLLGASGEASEPYYALNDKDAKDIAQDLERIMGDLESREALAFHGEPLDDEDRELLRRSLENSLIVARQMAKKKFTPNKYRD
ncbi:XRE family transcriptional regulator [Paenibacillaceae bacterium]|nr:XRE family transcriptional regulator [Paenibacillaceae bacterium]